MVCTFKWAGKHDRLSVTLTRGLFNGRAAWISKTHDFGAFIKCLTSGIIHCCAIAVITPRASNRQ